MEEQSEAGEAVGAQVRMFGLYELAWDGRTVWVADGTLVGRFGPKGWSWWPMGQPDDTHGVARIHEGADPASHWAMFCTLFATLTEHPMPAGVAPTWLVAVEPTPAGS